jgi:fructose-1,6-bisphosphatase-3
MYQAYNGNLLYHASVPMTEEGDFAAFIHEGEAYSGKALLDLFDQLAREAYFNSRQNNGDTDFLWFLWCHPMSPIFGKDKMATFERYFIDDKGPHKESFRPYFHLINDEAIAEKILMEFGLDPHEGHIINGHVPVRIPKGESPIRAKGRLLVIDGGFSSAYRKTTGIAGYTLIFNSYGLQLAAHEPFESIEKAIQEGQDIRSTVRVIEKTVERKRVNDTDIGKDLKRQIEYLEMLIAAYRKGIIKEKLTK